MTLGLVGLLVTGCIANSPSIMVLPHGQASLPEFQVDDATCQEYAQPIAKTAAQREGNNNIGLAIVHGMLGAAVGASIGSGFGLTAYGAQVGGTNWMAHGLAYGSGREQTVRQRAFDIAYAQCMRTKGHKLPGFQSIDDQPVRTEAPQETPQCADPTIRKQCPLYQYRTGIYRGTCQDTSSIEVGPDYVKGFPPTMGQRPHPWQAEGCVVANSLPTF